MANDQKFNVELEDLAAEFAKSSAAVNPRIDASQRAIIAFREASAFLACVTNSATAS